jgi:hypothetical protein
MNNNVEASKFIYFTRDTQKTHGSILKMYKNKNKNAKKF